MAIFMVAVDKGGKSALGLSRELGLSYVSAWLLHPKIQQAMADRNRLYKLGRLLELDDSYFGGVSHGSGKRGRGTDQDPVVVGVSLNGQGHPQYAFLEAVSDVTNKTIAEVLARRVEPLGVWRTDSWPAYAAAAKIQQADHEVTRSDDPQAPVVFHWVNVLIRPRRLSDGTSLKTLNGYRFNRRHFETRIAVHLLMACSIASPHPYGI